MESLITLQSGAAANQTQLNDKFKVSYARHNIVLNIINHQAPFENLDVDFFFSSCKVSRYII